MTFKLLEPCPDPDCVYVWSSKPTGRYRIVLVRMLYGFRCNLMHDFGQPHDRRKTWVSYEAVYCLGLHIRSMQMMPRIIMAALGGVDESARVEDLRKLLPKQSRKPLFNDPRCLQRLCELAGVPDAADIIIDDAWDDIVPDVRASIGLEREGRVSA